MLLERCLEKKKVKEIERIPLSNNTVTQRIDEMDQWAEDELMRIVICSIYYALQLDESTDLQGLSLTSNGRRFRSQSHINYYRKRRSNDPILEHEQSNVRAEAPTPRPESASKADGARTRIDVGRSRAASGARGDVVCVESRRARTAIAINVDKKLFCFGVVGPPRCRGKVLGRALFIYVFRDSSRMCIETFIAIHGRTAMRHDLVHFIRHTSSDHYCEGGL
ncbi:hypothetical protein EVAR_102956_1 [Eumeta japonica]|uniref:DUF4371 domain-containing protein n=1 Tax=Eumeta variegata TaxID=151549 RepID=A0A4C1UPN4_EUMVA|nr:hypothetical protein EVAR_102956_1 [Eumeta japonica]